ncbi:uncharacterized protein LOC144288669 isoform X2 [Canis aureus]
MLCGPGSLLLIQEKNLESRITESEGLWKVIQVQRRELCWQNKVHGAKVWMKVTATGRAELEESSTNVSGHHRKACPSLTYGQSFAVCLIFQLRRHREEPIYTPPSVLLHILDGQPTALKTAHRKEECHSLHMITGPSEFLTHLSTRTCFQSLRRFILHLVGEAPAMGVGYSGWAVREQDRLKDCPALYHRVPA